MEKMKAVVIDKTIRPDKLSYCDVEKPVPSENEVLLKIHAVAVNAADYRSLQMGMIPKQKILGADIAGTVESVGKNIQQFKVGDEVLGDLGSFGFGGFAEYTVAPEAALVHKPAKLSFEEAAALPMSSLTALQALRNKGVLQKGQQVLLYGGGGGVGTFAIQLAKYFGAETTVVCSSKNIAQSNALGADTVLDYTQQDALKTDKRYDLILAINGNRRLLDYKRALKPHGIYVMVGGSLPQIFKSLLFGWFLSFGSKKMRTLAAKANQNDLEFIAKLAEEGILKPVISQYYSLDKVAEAMSQLRAGHSSGKVVIQI
jgi:NADPH:quinone reductase-like Zn-dependent oxidoreductase